MGSIKRWVTGEDKARKAAKKQQQAAQAAREAREREVANQARIAAEAATAAEAAKFAQAEKDRKDTVTGDTRRRRRFAGRAITLSKGRGGGGATRIQRVGLSSGDGGNAGRRGLG